MEYFFDIAGVIVKVVCPNNLYLIDDWKIFFGERWGKLYLLDAHHKFFDIEIEMVGHVFTKIVSRRIEVQKKVFLPVIKDNKMIFNNFLHPSLFLFLMYPLLARKFEKTNVFVLHASGVLVNNKLILVFGKSGSGKTTFIRNISLVGGVIFGDDFICLRKIGDQVFAFPTFLNYKILPPDGILNRWVGVDKVLMIAKNKEFSVKKIKIARALVMMLGENKGLMKSRVSAIQAMELFKILAEETYVLGYNGGSDLGDYVLKWLK